MGKEYLIKIIISLLSGILLFIISRFIKAYAKKTQVKNNLDISRYYSIKRSITFISYILFLLSLVFVWGINVKNMWIGLTGFMAMVAIAFFAVWSLIGNILAGILLYFTTPFKINDTIEICPDNIKGKVLMINMFFTLIVDENGDNISIPNSMCFQKYIKNIKKRSV